MSRRYHDRTGEEWEDETEDTPEPPTSFLDTLKQAEAPALTELIDPARKPCPVCGGRGIVFRDNDSGEIVSESEADWEHVSAEDCPLRCKELEVE
jgi:hypothetical protein